MLPFTFNNIVVAILAGIAIVVLPTFDKPKPATGLQWVIACNPEWAPGRQWSYWPMLASTNLPPFSLAPYDNLDAVHTEVGYLNGYPGGPPPTKCQFYGHY
jgi:hypothetical protein